MKQSMKWLILALAVAALAAAGYWWYQRQASKVPAPATEPQISAPVSPSKPVAIVTEPARIQYPVEVEVPPSRALPPLPTLEKSDLLLRDSLIELLGQKDVARFLQVDEFVRRFVATVDNLARGHAASRMWPVAPTPGRTLVIEKPDGVFMVETNSERYTPFVKFATAIDVERSASIYARLYPLFQQAYEELGYPGKYFNDRLVAVIDQLLEAPELTEPIRLTLTQVQGPIPSSQPWLRYEFEDPELEARPAGQKILMRMGRANEAKLKSKLREFRTRIVRRQSAR